MVELTVGSRFWYKGKLYEVVESESGYMCRECVFLADGKCKKSKCYSDERHDGKIVYFSEVRSE